MNQQRIICLRCLKDGIFTKFPSSYTHNDIIICKVCKIPTTSIDLDKELEITSNKLEDLESYFNILQEADDTLAY